MKKLMMVLAIAVSGIMLYGCARIQPAGTNSHLLQKWRLQSIQGLSDAEVLQTKGFIDFTGGAREQKAFSGVGCNRIFFEYRLSGNNLSFSNIGRTKMMCENIAMEEAYIALLEKVASYQTKGHYLMLKDAAGNVLIKAVDLNWQ